MWDMRATTYRYFERNILQPLERRAASPLDILDLGAGNCWMSHRLALRTHRVVALDIFRDELDGLLARRHYPAPPAAVEAEFDCLPFREATFDLAIYNSSFHYSTSYVKTLAELRRCLRPTGLVAILDTPIYRRRAHGERMVEERHTAFHRRYGFRSDAMPSIQFLDPEALDELGRSLNLSWTIYRPWYGLHWHLRPYKARLLRRRPPSRFWILLGRFHRP